MITPTNLNLNMRPSDFLSFGARSSLIASSFQLATFFLNFRKTKTILGQPGDIFNAHLPDWAASRLVHLENKTLSASQGTQCNQCNVSKRYRSSNIIIISVTAVIVLWSAALCSFLPCQGLPDWADSLKFPCMNKPVPEWPIRLYFDPWNPFQIWDRRPHCFMILDFHGYWVQQQ